ncbi:MAG TPA: c-type cytochrome [Vicinamibacterales bacterium]|nr:c-type cytochrome [Vicinamibacterales bacterium]HOQ59208.1 c-type cytochrome [Vicinamibacterales bacterium]HPK70701.1 c-type cytochrome [Vicinamibacterales bacterium]
MNKNKYLLLVSSAAVLLLLIGAAVQETFLQEWRRLQARARTDEGPIPIQLRQVVNDSLRAADRCVSCHVAMGPGEQGVRGEPVLAAHKPVVHDPAEFGCTICHAGQGQATTRSEAHGDVRFWPEPMIPARFSYAGCGRCHATLGVPEHRQLQAAAAAFERLDCLSCHRVDGRGGTLRPDGGGMEGPDLSRVGLAGYDPGWYETHLNKARTASAGPWRGAVGPSSDEDRRLLALFLSTRVASPMLVEAKSVFHSAGCLGCHKVSGVGGDDGMDLSRAGDKDPGQVSFHGVPGQPTIANWQLAHFRSPASIVAGSLMPPVAASDRELDLLAMYVLSLRRRDLPEVYVPPDRARSVKLGEREFAGDGATLFGAFCSGCHGQDGLGRRLPGVLSFPSIASLDFLAIASDGLIVSTIERGRTGRRMAAWLKPGGLRPAEVRAVAGYLRSLGGVPPEEDPRPARWVTADAAAGRKLFDGVCAGCHGPAGEGGEGPALNSIVLRDSATDTFLVKTIGRGRRGTVMPGFLSATPAYPALASADIEDVVAYLRVLQGGGS